MKITEKVVSAVMGSVREDVSNIAEEQAQRLVKALDEQIRLGGDSSITLKIDVTLTDKGMSENAIEVQTRFGFVRKVKDEDSYVPHVIDLGPTLFDAKEKEREIGGSVVRIDIDGDKHCAECGKPGTADNGLCLACTNNAVAGKRMKSIAGQIVQKRAKAIAERG